ncbi:hypothetical protein THAOC_20933, partial [Thalassiosira oceanica]
MADDGSVKRPKTAIEDDVPAVVQGRIAQLESEVQRLRFENAQLRQCRQQQLEGNHEVLPVSLPPFAVDLSRVDTSIVAHVASFLGESRELLNLALTCKSFGWRQPASTLNLSLVEEVARQAVCSRATDVEKRGLPQYVSGTMTCLSILNRFEHLLVFDVLLGCNIEHKNGDPSVICGKLGDDWDGIYERCCTAVSSSYVMTSGVHYAEFEVSGVAFVGIVRPMPGLDAGRYLEGECNFIHSKHLYSDFLAQRSDDWGGSNVHVCEYDMECEEGLSWSDWVEGGYGGSFASGDYEYQ